MFQLLFVYIVYRNVDEHVYNNNNNKLYIIKS